MISLEAFSELIQVLYATPLHPQQWTRFLDLVCQHTGSRNSFLLCANSRRGLSVQAQGGKPVDMTLIKSYNADYAPTDPLRLPLLRSGKTGVVDCNELLEPQALLDSEMFRNVNAPLGLRWPGLVALTCSLRRMEVISIWRAPEEGPLSDEANDLLQMLVPHIHSALEIREVLGVSQERLSSAETMADASSTATFLLSPDGEMHHCNEAARALLRAGDGLVEANGALRAAHVGARPALRNLLQAAGAAASPRNVTPHIRALSVERTSGARPLQLLASPLPDEDSTGPKPTILLLVTDPEKPISLRDDLMREHYSFSPAETEIANGLLTGYSLEEIAALRHVATSTVRHQLKNIFRKTATSRQSDLVRLLLNLPQHPVEES